MTGPPCLCIAHRGASGYEPENTIRSFRRALDLGATWVEFDVRAVENEIVVFHDRTLKRMTQHPGIVEKQTLSFIRSLNLAHGERIPLLSEALSCLKGRASAQIELKGHGTGTPVARAVLESVAHGWSVESFLVSSFDQHELVAFKNLAPTIPIGLLTYGYPLNCIEIAQKLGAYSVHLHIDAVSPSRIQELQTAGRKVYVYTVNEPSDIEALRDMGVDGIFSDFPDRVLALG